MKIHQPNFETAQDLPAGLELSLSGGEYSVVGGPEPAASFKGKGPLSLIETRMVLRIGISKDLSECGTLQGRGEIVALQGRPQGYYGRSWSGHARM